MEETREEVPADISDPQDLKRLLSEALEEWDALSRHVQSLKCDMLWKGALDDVGRRPAERVGELLPEPVDELLPEPVREPLAEPSADSLDEPPAGAGPALEPAVAPGAPPAAPEVEVAPPAVTPAAGLEERLGELIELLRQNATEPHAGLSLPPTMFRELSSRVQAAVREELGRDGWSKELKEGSEIDRQTDRATSDGAQRDKSRIPIDDVAGLIDLLTRGK